MSKPLVSIIMPAYNAQSYIVEAIASVLEQSYTHFELIVIDDGSTDNTLTLVKGFDDRRIVLKHQANAGVSMARNLGLSLASGEYITFLDADDVFPKESLAARVAYLDKNPHIAVVDGEIVVKDATLSTTLRTYSPYYQGALLPRLLALDSRVFFNVCYLFRREILGTVRFKEGMSHAEDLLFYMMLASQKSVIYGFVEKEIYYYRSGHNSTMTNIQGLQDGYILLLKTIKRLPSISKKAYIVLKLKIMKILFLSWLGTHRPQKALHSTVSIARVS